MRHGRAGFKLGRVTAHRWALFRNLLVALFRHERITTTVAKAKAVRGLADHMVTLAKRDNLHARRQVLAMVPDPLAVRILTGITRAIWLMPVTPTLLLPVAPTIPAMWVP